MSAETEDRADTPSLTFLAGGGELGARMRSLDWSPTPLGPPASWPQSLKMATALMLGASVPISVYWGSDLLLLYNDAWRDLLGDKDPGALGRPARELFPEIWETIGPLLAGVLAGEGGTTLPAHFLPRNRWGQIEEAWFDCSFSPLLRVDGSAGGILAIAAETSNRPRGPEAWQESAALLQVAYSAAHLGVYSRDLRTGTDYWSPEFLDIYGLQPGELLPLQDRIPLMIHPEDREQVLAESRARFERHTDPRFSSEHRIIRPDGQVRWVLVQGRVTFDPQGQPLATHGIIMDITARKATEAALRELAQSLEAERNRLSAILDNLPVGVWIADEAGRLVGKNAQADRIWLGQAPLLESIDEYTQYEARHSASGQRLLPDDYPVARAVRTRQPVEPTELQIRRFDGSEGTVLASAAPIRDSQDVFRGVVGINVDITEHKQAEVALRERERQLSALTQELEKRVEARTLEVRELATRLTLAEHEERARIAQILHDDLQQHLYAMQIQLDFLRAEAPREELLQEIAKVEETLLEAIETTRQLNVDVSPPILEGEGLVEALHWLAGQMEKRYQLDVTLEAEGSLPVPPRDRRVLLFQMVRELLFNIVKHAGVSQAEVRLQLIQDGEIGAAYRIDVVDEGVGFNPQAALGEEVASRNRGLRQLSDRLRLFGGRLELASRSGEGTHVIILAPIGEAPARTPVQLGEKE